MEPSKHQHWSRSLPENYQQHWNKNINNMFRLPCQNKWRVYRSTKSVSFHDMENIPIKFQRNRYRIASHILNEACVCQLIRLEILRKYSSKLYRLRGKSLYISLLVDPTSVIQTIYCEGVDTECGCVQNICQLMSHSQQVQFIDALHQN